MNRHVFISYRADDGIDKATALARDLDRLFGDEQVFLDKDDLAAGSRWREEIARTIGGRPILLVLVTPQYLGAVDGAGRRRIERDDDPVRLELSAALAAGAHVVPLLCDGVDHTPDAATLPAPFDQLGELTWRRLRAYDWRADVARLAGDLERLGVERRGGGPGHGAAAAVAGVAVPVRGARGAEGAGATTGTGAGVGTGTGTETGPGTGTGTGAGVAAETASAPAAGTPVRTAADGPGGDRRGAAQAHGGGKRAGHGTADAARPGNRRRLALAAVAVAAAVAGAVGWLAWRQPGVASRSPLHPMAPVSLPQPASAPPARGADAAPAGDAGAPLARGDAGAPPARDPASPAASAAPDARVPPPRDAGAPPARQAGVPPRDAVTLPAPVAGVPPARDGGMRPGHDAAAPPATGPGDAGPSSAGTRRDAASAAVMTGRWMARLGAPGAASATGGTPLVFEVVQRGDRLRLTSEPVDVGRDPEWREYREFWQQRHRRPLQRVRWRGEGELIASPGEPRRVSIAMRVEAAATGEAIDAGRLTGWVGDAGRRIEGRLWVDGEQGERPMVLRMRSALLPER